jgi:hypothetical protein
LALGGVLALVGLAFASREGKGKPTKHKHASPVDELLNELRPIPVKEKSVWTQQVERLQTGMGFRVHAPD